MSLGVQPVMTLGRTLVWSFLLFWSALALVFLTLLVLVLSRSLRFLIVVVI